MKVQRELLEDNKVRLTITIEAEEVDAKIKACYKDFAHNHNFPGFRKGKAPRKVIDSAIGKEAVLATATDQLMKESYPKAVSEQDLYPISSPTWEDDDILVVQGEDLVYRASVEVKPEFELSSYEPVTIEMISTEVSDEEALSRIEMLRELSFTLEDVPASEKVVERSFMEANVKAFDDKGKEIDTFNAEKRTFGLGMETWPTSFEEQLLGMQAGQSKSFELSAADEEVQAFLKAAAEDVADAAEVADGADDGAAAADDAVFEVEDGAMIHFEVEILALKERLVPELDDVWAGKMGFESAELLKEEIKKSIAKDRSAQMQMPKGDKCMHELVGRLEGEPPESLISDAEARLLSEFFQRLQDRNWTLDAYLIANSITSDQFRDDMKKQAGDVCRQELALDAWARHAGMKVTAEEITQEFVESGVEDPAKLEAEWWDRGDMYLIKADLLRARAAKDVIDTAIVKEPEEDAESVENTADAQSAEEKGDKKPAKKAAADKAESKKTAKNPEKDSEKKKPAVKKAASK